ncbi:MAG: hypothetical protein IPG71_05925 [bacterium]|nr:hypothetical protein [bacterium]
MNRISWFLSCLLCVFVLACDNESDRDVTFPAEPTPDMLAAGPGGDSEFFRWNDAGRERATAANFRAALWVTNDDTTHIQITDMVGLFVYPGCLGSHAAVECDIVVEDPEYSQLEYGPSGMVFADSVELWLDSTVLELPQNTFAADVAYFYYNPASGEFEELDSWVNPDNGWIEAKVTHFSRYILGRKRTNHN